MRRRTWMGGMGASLMACQWIAPAPERGFEESSALPLEAGVDPGLDESGEDAGVGGGPGGNGSVGAGSGGSESSAPVAPATVSDGDPATMRTSGEEAGDASPDSNVRGSSGGAGQDSGGPGQAGSGSGGVPDASNEPPALPLEPGAGPSCSGASFGCGPSTDESCCALAYVPGGLFRQGFDDVLTPGAPHSPARAATISGYWLGAYEVTVERFGRFLADYDAWRDAGNPRAGAGAPAHASVESGWRSDYDAFLAENAAALADAADSCFFSLVSTLSTGFLLNRPINCVSWYEAAAFCAWDRGRLPTEAEWEFAAAGGGEERIYPWGFPVTPFQAIEAVAFNVYRHPLAVSPPIASAGALAAGRGRFGHLDLAGNVDEWVLDTFVRDEYVQHPVCSDCVSAIDTADAERVQRGGGYDADANLLRAHHREAAAGSTRSQGTGFRCAYDTAGAAERPLP